MDLRRIELLTSSLQMRRSSHLNYRPWIDWWAYQDSNLGPQSYQDCALASWAIRPSIQTLKRTTLKAKKWQESRVSPWKEVIQPQIPLRLPCYDLTPVISLTFVIPFLKNGTPSGTTYSHGLTGGVCKTRERIHRDMADSRLLANPTSRGRVSDLDLNWDRLLGLAPPYGLAAYCTDHCSVCVAQDIRAMRTRRHPHLPPRFTEAVSQDTCNMG